ncbi:hypothetical protein SAMN00120144_0939 [Hymenobacter roseosalivarius DSM 11622]|uniref:Uncharacterized protein n=1 Tax=Hymenobacter roseosalivarius DSM 11622 TaxID=645990 RepID=A0A1W1V871_9BACT|nr:hypothetical protein SAMN00120144_0939 [Hymenobacter roseosalivarius DSM 11622]
MPGGFFVLDGGRKVSMYTTLIPVSRTEGKDKGTKNVSE